MDRSPLAGVCAKAAAGCELDHAVPWAANGRTSADNLWAACGRDHDLKEQPGWGVTLHADGRLEWLTPTGHRYSSEPWDYRDEPLPSDPSRSVDDLRGPPDPGGTPTTTATVQRATPGPADEPPPF